jgi:3-oxoacyl-[acyl-carrier-protein] synthase-3
MSPIWNIPGIRMSSVAAALPSVTVSNDDLIRAGGDPEYIERMSDIVGVSHRHVVSSGQLGSGLAIDAAARVMEHEGWGPHDVDVLVVGTQTPDRLFPGISFTVHRALGLSTDCAVFDVNLGCSAFVYGAWIIASLLRGDARRGLLVTVDVMSRTLRADDFGNRVLFGDAAAAVAFERGDPEAVIVASMASDGRGESSVCLPGTAMTTGIEEAAGFHINGPAVLALALRSVPRMIEEALAQSAGDDVLLVPHQANEFILDKLRERMKWPEDRFIVAMRDVGNTSSASIPLALCSGDSRLAGDRSQVAMVGFGTGFSWGTLIADLRLTSMLGTALVEP